MNKHTILLLAKKEFLAFINNSLAYVVAVPFLLISLFLFARSALLSGDGSMRSYFELLPWFLVIVAPALSMKLFTDERKQGTLELLLSRPITETEIVLGKYAGAMAFYTVLLAGSLTIPVTLLLYAQPDIGVMATQYIGALLVGGLFLSIGLTASLLVTQTVGSFLLAAAINFALCLIGLNMVVLAFPWPFNIVATELGVLTHISTIARGALDIRDVVYFFTVTGLMLTGAVFKLSHLRLTERPAQKRALYVGFGLIAAIGFVLNTLLYFYPLRIDLTRERLFTLSAGTKQTIKNLPDIVTITVYASRNLPGQMQSTLREINDMLSDLKRQGGNITVVSKYPDSDLVAAQEARTAGIQEVTFNTIGTGKFEAQNGFLGIALRFGDKVEVLPFIQDTSDLEYQLTRRIRKMTTDIPITIGLFNAAAQSYSLLPKLLELQYTVTPVTEENLATVKPAGLIVIDDGTIATTSGALRSYLQNGGSILFLSDGAVVNKQLGTVDASKPIFTDLFADYGIVRTNELVYDMELNETLSFGQGGVQYVIPYPFWFHALPKDTTFAGSAGIKSVVLAWATRLELTAKDGVEQRQILISSKTSGVQKENYTITPDSFGLLPKPTGEEYLVAALAQKDKSRLVVVGDTDLAQDEFLQTSKENAAFIANTVDFLVADSDLASIPVKTAGRSVFHFKKPYEPLVFQYGTILIAPTAFIIFGVAWLGRRRRLTRRVYEN